jgi:hypothetical protein
MRLPSPCRLGRCGFTAAAAVDGVAVRAEAAAAAVSCWEREWVRACVLALDGKRWGGMVMGDFERVRVRERERMRRMRAVMAPKKVSSVEEWEAVGERGGELVDV